MELQSFITQALLDIVNGVVDAQSQVNRQTSIIPDVNEEHDRVNSRMQVVKFDVSIRIDDQKGSEGKLGVLSGVIGAGIAGNSSSATEHLTKLQFSIPISFPIQKHEQS